MYSLSKFRLNSLSLENDLNNPFLRDMFQLDKLERCYMSEGQES